MNNEKNISILFVDDEESILDIASEFFQYKGYTIYTAEHGKAAVSILEKEKIDICFTDIEMPEMDGIQLTEYIKNLEYNIPVIIMTGYPSLDITIKTLKSGVVDFLIKPVNLEQMEFSVKRVLRERELFFENIVLAKEVESKKRIEKLNIELTEKIQEVNKLNKIMSDFSEVRSSVDLFKRVTDLSLEITSADESRFFIFNETIKEPFEVTSSFKNQNLKEKKQNPDFQELIMDVMEDGNPLIVPENNSFKGLNEETLSFLAVPLKIREQAFGLVAIQINSGEGRFNENDLYYVNFMTEKAINAIENLALYENIYENLFSTLSAFVAAVEARDKYTKQHSSRVAEIAIKIAEQMNCSKEDINVLNFAGKLHDIGKIGIRDEILLKAGRLTSEEFEKIMEHPIIGANIVGKLGLWEQEKTIIKHHHERYDGKGYPDGLAKEEIPLLARILSVADSYDAMASDRAYRKKMENEKVIKCIKENEGSQFDPAVVKAFLEIVKGGDL